MTTQIETTLSGIIKDRIARQSGERTRKQIAQAVGLENEETLKMIESGAMKLPLEYTLKVADELGLERREFALLAMRQFFSSDFVDVLADHTELDEMRELANATLIAYQVEVTLIGSHVKAVEKAALECLEAAAGIAARQSNIAQAIHQQLDGVG
jgi:hypothetical protein